MAEFVATRDASGWEVLHAGLETAHAALGERLVAAYALGSLAHGGFAPDVSDVDLALIVHDLSVDLHAIVSQVQRHVASQFDSPLASRLSVFWSSWRTLLSHGKGGRFPLADRLDLLNSGLVLFGVDKRSELLLPDADTLRRELVIEAAEFMLDKLVSGPDTALPLSASDTATPTCRAVTKAVLFPVRFIYTAERGGIATNRDAVDYYCRRSERPSTELVMRAFRWREDGRLGSPEDVRSILKQGLAPLYLELIRVYVEALRREEVTELEQRLLRWATAIPRVA
jgi:hypothetical protein